MVNKSDGDSTHGAGESRTNSTYSYTMPKMRISSVMFFGYIQAVRWHSFLLRATQAALHKPSLEMDESPFVSTALVPEMTHTNPHL